MGLIKTLKIRAFPVISGVVAGDGDKYAVALKKSNGNILLDKGNKKFLSESALIFIRGIIALFDTGKFAGKMLTYSADYFDNENPEAADTEILSKQEYLNKQAGIKTANVQKTIAFFGTMILLAAAIVGLFILPVFTASVFFDNVREESRIWFNVAECVSRLILLFLYFFVFNCLGGAVKEFRQYNCAVNKALNCFEEERELTLENVKQASSFHPRSAVFIFFLSTVILSVALIFVKSDSLIFGLFIRLVAAVLSIGSAYEISRLFGSFNGASSRRIAMICGMYAEKFTVSNPDDMQIYVAVTAIKNSMIEG